MIIPEFWHDSWTAAVMNHLWQSTVAVGIAWLLAFVLRKNHSGVRYWVWMVASVKFLVPFSLLTEVGKWIRSLNPAPAAQSAVASVMKQVTQPFGQTQFLDSGNAPNVPTAFHQASLLPVLLVTVWLCGVLIAAIRFGHAWAKVNAAKRGARPLELAAEVPVFSSSASIEPGVCGVFRPVLLLPEGILERLSSEQMGTVIAHEICHVRRRDNLTFAVHMVVETLFWFHPLVWWIGTRLIDEREQACDEAVVQAGDKAQVYAEGILNVCKFYVESPLPFLSGVTGADLKKRILRIVSEGVVRDLSMHKRALLVAVGVAAIVAPLTLGLFRSTPTFARTSPHSQAQSAPSSLPEFEVASIRPSGPAQRELNGLYTYPGGMVVCKGCTVQYLIMEALNVQPYQISGGPGWINLVRGQRFDIQAKPPASSLSARSNPAIPKLPPNSEQRQMLLSLLIHRFQLQFQGTTNQGRVLYLTRGSKPLKLHPPADKNAFPWAGGISGGSLGGGVRGENISMPQLAQRLSGFLHCPVFDRTGLKAAYDFEYRIGDEHNDNDIPEVLRLAMKGIGLNLTSGRGPVETIIVEHVDQPSAN